MKITGNTILITGGGSGIGRGMAEAFHKQGNQVIVAGRRKEALQDVVDANPGMRSLALDIGDKAGVAAFAEEAIRSFPGLNVIINNAGVMKMENLLDPPGDLVDAEATIATNLLGPIRLTAAFMPHLRRQPHAAVLTVSSGLAFVPMALTPTYSATKAAIHSYSESLRHQLKGTDVEVIEIAPPYVQTHLMGERQASDPRAMPLDEFITEVMHILADQPTVKEVIVDRCKPLRFARENGNADAMFETINAMAH